MKNVTKISLSVIGMALFGVATYSIAFHGPQAPTVNFFRIQAQESREREIQAQKDREAREDQLSEALYDKCLAENRTLSGVLFAEKQKKAYECWKDELAKTNSGTYTGGTAPVPERIEDIRCPELYLSGRKIESPRIGVTFTFSIEEAKELYPKCPITNSSANVTKQSTVRPHTQGSSGGGGKIQQAPKASGKGVGTPVPSGGKIPPTPTVNPNGNTQSKGSSEKVCPKKVILRNGWNDPRVQYAYDISCGDMDFIKTIEAESRWDVNASGDGHKSIGLCQIHRGYNPELHKNYKALGSDNEKVAMCYGLYKDWVKRGVIKTRLYGYNVRNLPQNKKPFTLQ